VTADRPPAKAAPRTVADPTADEAATFVGDAIEQGALVTLFGCCTVEYEGRAASELGPGDRHVMLKPDGTALVHTNEGQKPVNWQPPGCDHECRADGGTLVVESVRASPSEQLTVSFLDVALAAAFDPTDGTSIEIAGTEADLKQRILEEPTLVETGFAPLATERETPAGAVDIYGEDSEGRTVVVELKRRRVGPDAVGQLNRYVEALERDLHARVEVRGILVAPSVTRRARQLLAEEGFDFVPLQPRE
jgi:RecB family endonuclease NucS